MAIEHGFAGMAVVDLAPAVAWYERLFGRPADMAPNANEVVWRLTDTLSVYVVHDPARAGNSLLTLMFDDLDAVRRELESRGIATGAVESAPGLYRKIVISDPSANRIQVGEAPAATAD